MEVMKNVASAIIGPETKIRYKELPITQRGEIDIILFHKGCMDGFCSAWIAHVYYKWNEKKEPVYIEIGYGDDKTYDFRGKRVIAFDLSLSSSQVVKICEEAKSFYLLDHHETSFRELVDFPNKLLDIEHCGAYLTYKYFFPDSNVVPDCVLYVQDRDLWTWNMLYSREFSAYLYYRMKNDFNAWDDKFVRIEDEELVFIGGMELVDNFYYEGSCYMKVINECVRKSVFFCTSYVDSPLPVAFVEATNFKSEVADSILYSNKSNNRPVLAIVWSFDSAKTRYNISARSPKDFENAVNCALLAERFKEGEGKSGGGHKHAAGFKMTGTFSPKFMMTNIIDVARHIFCSQEEKKQVHIVPI